MLYAGIYNDNLFYKAALDGTGRQVYGNDGLSIDTWYYVVCHADNADNELRTYYDTTHDGTLSQSYSAINTNNEDLWIGCNARWPEEAFDGDIDEVRISNVVRSIGWMKTTYSSQNTPSDFYSMGIEESKPTALSVLELELYNNPPSYNTELYSDSSSYNVEMFNSPAGY